MKKRSSKSPSLCKALVRKNMKHPDRYQFRRHKEAVEQVQRCRQQLSQVLDGAVQEENLGHDLGDAFIFLHQSPQGRDNLCTEPHIRIDHKVILASYLYRLAKCHVMASAIAFVRLLDVFQPETSSLVLQIDIILPLILLQLSLQARELVAMVYNPENLNRRDEQAAKDSLQVQEVVIVCYYRGRYHSKVYYRTKVR